MKTYVIKETSDGWFISYKDPFWVNVKEKCIFFTHLEHKNKFIEILEEAGYKREQ